MRVNLEVVLEIDGTGVIQGGVFFARNKGDVIRVAHEYIQQLKWETGMRPTVIASVKVNGQHDITQWVRDYREYDTNFDNLPF
jgi:hypothetical protein